MYKVFVSMGDLYGSAHFDMECDSLSIEDIRLALDDMFPFWSERLSRQGAGGIRVSHKGEWVAEGSLVWWALGGYSIRLEAIGREPSACSEPSPVASAKRGRTSPTCCALV